MVHELDEMNRTDERVCNSWLTLASIWYHNIKDILIYLFMALVNEAKIGKDGQEITFKPYRSP